MTYDNLITFPYQILKNLHVSLPWQVLHSALPPHLRHCLQPNKGQQLRLSSGSGKSTIFSTVRKEMYTYIIIYIYNIIYIYIYKEREREREFFFSTLDWFASINFLVEFSGISRLAVLMASEHLLLAPDILDDFLARFFCFSKPWVAANLKWQSAPSECNPKRCVARPLQQQGLLHESGNAWKSGFWARVHQWDECWANTEREPNLRWCEKLNNKKRQPTDLFERFERICEVLPGCLM